jgi:shikimate dehydrogenase
MSRCIGLIGYPLGHSVSPYFQQAALNYYQLDVRYVTWETAPAQLQETVNMLRRPENVGANVTVPHKETVLHLLDDVDDLAGLIGAVNTVVKQGNKLVGFNTDAHGFIEALEKAGHFNAEGKRVVMLGAGGVARAAGLVLVQKRIASLAITDGVFERARALTRNLAKYGRSAAARAGESEASITAFEWTNVESAGTFADCDLIVHCTTIGMRHSSQDGASPLSLKVIPKNVLVYDMVYNPSPTPLLMLAQKAGANILGGLPMLVYQGAASFKLWTDREAPVDIMFNKAREMLIGGNW